MAPDRSRHSGMLPIGNSELFGRLFDNPSQRRVVGVAHVRAQMMGDVMVEPAREPAYERIGRRIICRCREDVINAVVKLVAVRREICAVDRVCGLEYQRYGQTDDQMDQQKRPSDQKRRYAEQYDGQDEHVGQVERLPRKKDRVFSRRMPGALQIFVGRKRKSTQSP